VRRSIWWRRPPSLKLRWAKGRSFSPYRSSIAFPFFRSKLLKNMGEAFLILHGSKVVCFLASAQQKSAPFGARFCTSGDLGLSTHEVSNHNGILACFRYYKLSLRVGTIFWTNMGESGSFWVECYFKKSWYDASRLKRTEYRSRVP
jgi:hypothetical protein